VRVPPVNHVELGPAVLDLGASAGADKEVELHLALQAILLDVVGLVREDGRKLAARQTESSMTRRTYERHGRLLRVTDACRVQRTTSADGSTRRVSSHGPVNPLHPM
jgi:hypothetical protein